MCNFSKKGDKTEFFLAMTVVAAEQLMQKHSPKYPAIHIRKRSYIYIPRHIPTWKHHKNTYGTTVTASLRETTQLQFNSPKPGKPSS